MTVKGRVIGRLWQRKLPWPGARFSAVPTEKVAAYWDANRQKAKDPAFWMAHPFCRMAINRRVTGSPQEWPLDWLKRTRVTVPFERGVSWGCGTGTFERSAVRAGIVAEIDAFDIAPETLVDARRLAEEEGVAGIHYALGNFDAPKLKKGAYDIFFFHQSLHHVSRLERLFRALSKAAREKAAVYVDEYVGPSRRDWRIEQMEKARRVLKRLPLRARIPRKIEIPIEEGDPSEAIRSSEIVKFLRDHMDVAEWKPYGGQITSLVFPYLAPEWAGSKESSSEIAAMLEMEDEELAADPSSTHYLVAYGLWRPAAKAWRRVSFRR